jgi:hypothetical protein
VNLAPDYIAPVVGWRVWLVVGRAGSSWRLRSPVYDTLWPPRRELVAVCRGRHFGPESHPAPAERCGCGIHAAPARAAALYLEYRRGAVNPGVIGRVSLWGSVVECAHGWRASCAYPAHLYVPAGWAPGLGAAGVGETARALTVYGVPVEIIDARTESELLAALAGVGAPLGNPRVN